jgi:hypothetical protein
MSRELTPPLIDDDLEGHDLALGNEDGLDLDLDEMPSSPFSPFRGGELTDTKKAKPKKRGANTKKCSYCSKLVNTYGHWMHEQKCMRRKLPMTVASSTKKPVAAKKETTSTPRRKIKRKCDHCQRDFCNGPRDYENHVKKCKIYHKFILSGNRCSLCNYHAQIPGYLFIHLAKKHGDLLAIAKAADTSSPQKGDTSSKKPNVKISAKKNMETRYPCPHCQHQFRLTIELKKHLIACNKKGNQEPETVVQEPVSVVCQYCDNQVSTKYLAEHQKKCLEFSEFIDDKKCLVCGQRFAAKRNAFLHLNQMHSNVLHKDNEAAHDNGNQTPYKNKCKQCGKCFRLSIELRKHKNCVGTIDTTTPTSTKQCQYCKDLVSRYRFDEHEKLCIRYSDYVGTKGCNICDKKIRSQRQIYLHIIASHRQFFKNNSATDLEETIADEPTEQVVTSTREAEVVENAIDSTMSLNGGENDVPNPTINMPNEDDGLSNVAISDERTLSNNFAHDFDGVVGPSNVNVDDIRFVRQVMKRETTTLMELNPNNNGGAIRRADVYEMAINTVNVIDSKLITKLFICPICLGKLAYFAEIQDHIVQFHRKFFYRCMHILCDNISFVISGISPAHARRLGLKIEERLLDPEGPLQAI